MQPKLFIGSSTEAKDIVGTVVQALSGCAACVPWYTAPEFKSGGSFSTLHSLCSATDLYDFAVFIFTADDNVSTRGKRFASPRDNVVFEMGLFLGSLGPERVTGIVQISKKTLKVPSDLEGIGMPRFTFDPENKHQNIGSITNALSGFAQTVQEKGFREFAYPLAQRWGFHPDSRDFKVKLSANYLQSARQLIAKSRLAVAARIKVDDCNFEDDPDARYSPARPLPNPLSDMVFAIAESAFSKSIVASDGIEARVLLVPSSLDLATCKTLRAATQQGCRVVETLFSRAPTDT